METKTCSKCGETKELGEFYRNRTMKDGRSYWCKACDTAYHAKWSKDNRAYRTAYQVRRQRADREAHNAYVRECRAKRKAAANV